MLGMSSVSKYCYSGRPSVQSSTFGSWCQLNIQGLDVQLMYPKAQNLLGRPQCGTGCIFLKKKKKCWCWFASAVSDELVLLATTRRRSFRQASKYLPQSSDACLFLPATTFIEAKDEPFLDTRSAPRIP